MEFQEIVAAVVDSVVVTTNLARIDASRAMGCRLQFISRSGARSMANERNSSCWNALATAPTLMLCDNGIIYRSTRPVTAE